MMRYCSACGAEMPGDLNFCNRCGASLGAAAQTPAPVMAPMSFTKLAWITASMLITGLIVIFVAMDKMIERGVVAPAVVFITLFGLATLFSVTSMLLRLWERVSRIALLPSQPPQPSRQQTLYEQPRAAQLPPRPVNFGSVTDNTTRTFDPVYRDTMEQQ